VRNAGPGTRRTISLLFSEPQRFAEFLSAVFTLAVYEGAYMAEIIRAGVQSVPRGQSEAAYSSGLTRLDQYRFIILPQALKTIGPALAGQLISTVKDSAIVAVISVQELTFRGLELMSATFRTFEVWITITILYLILTGDFPSLHALWKSGCAAGNTRSPGSATGSGQSARYPTAPDVPKRDPSNEQVLSLIRESLIWSGPYGDTMNTEHDSTMAVRDTTANPAPLGLLGFGLTTILLNLHNAGFFPLDSMIMGMGVFVGGVAQVIAGMQEWKKGNTFGATAFTAYGLFWIALVSTWVLPAMGLSRASTPAEMGWFLLLWGLFTTGMFVGTSRLNRALQVVFATLAALFFLLAIRDFSGSAVIGVLAGWTGIVCGLSAFYTAIAQILNEIYGRTVMPIGG
jgi:succinate-acetate transporter protein